MPLADARLEVAARDAEARGNRLPPFDPERPDRERVQVSDGEVPVDPPVGVGAKPSEVEPPSTNVPPPSTNLPPPSTHSHRPGLLSGPRLRCSEACAQVAKCETYARASARPTLMAGSSEVSPASASTMLPPAIWSRFTGMRRPFSVRPNQIGAWQVRQETSLTGDPPPGRRRHHRPRSRPAPRWWCAAPATPSASPAQAAPRARTGAPRPRPPA